jgi:acylphosphatase
MKQSKILLKIRITGRVQGVGFRHSALREARYLGIKGYVKNDTDGSVYIEAEAESGQMDLFLNWCRQGPGYGHVDNVTWEQGLPINYSSFSIKF